MSTRYTVLLLVVSTLLHVKTLATVYTVTPDDHYYPNTTCHHCHNLQHYLLNVTKYFTSNTHLLFLPGLHHLHTDLIIQNIHNISLIGNETTIQSNLSFILMNNVSNLTIINITITSINQHGIYKIVPLTIKDCSFVVLYYVQVKQSRQRAYYNFALVAINTMGYSYFSHVKFHNSIQLLYNETQTHTKYHVLLMRNCTLNSIKLNMLQDSYWVTVKIMDSKINHALYKRTAAINDSFIYTEELGANELSIINCQFNDIIYGEQLLTFNSSKNGSVMFINCQFVNNFNMYNRIYTVMSSNFQTGLHSYVTSSLIKLYLNVRLELNNCYFHSDNQGEVQVLQVRSSSTNPANVLIKNATFSYYTSKTNPYKHWLDDGVSDFSFMHLVNSTLILDDAVVFNHITTPHNIISLRGNSTIIITGSVEFSQNLAQGLINFYDNDRKYIIMKEYSINSVSNNDVQSLFATSPTAERYPYSFCLFQYFSSNYTNLVASEKRKFLIIFCNNRCKKASCYDYMPATHCLWLPQSLFNDTTPLEVNSKYMQFIINSDVYNLPQIITQPSLCVCSNASLYDCHKFNLGYLYPGQTLAISLYPYKYSSNATNAVVVKTDITQQYVTPCTVLNVNENVQAIDENCASLYYTIGFPTENQCELFLKIASDSDDYLNTFSIWQLTCPIGFFKIDERCQCDPVLVQYGITNCNINDQTILRPANSWITATTHNNSYTYHISSHCPYHYCLPHSSHLNLSTPNSQCQFNRSGLLCGHCQHGLSTVFGSSYCKHCSSLYLLLIIPIAIAGLVLVLLLFVLNLTVTDGTINGFILYANIISINTPVFFTDSNQFTPTYTFISLANLDLGIQTCFYNGMDDYAKMWLQLAFPFYLIFIATLIIITNRYSTTIQRLTARRALPVLATLFLLSYTKILCTVSSVLFFYSTITHLPSKDTKLVWSVDANVPLFGVRFTILFIVCLILFLILVPFNVILLFTGTLSRFRFIDKLSHYWMLIKDHTSTSFITGLVFILLLELCYLEYHHWIGIHTSQ